MAYTDGPVPVANPWAADLRGVRVRGIWPDDGTLTDACGVVDHMSWGEDGRPELMVSWDSDYLSDGELRYRQVPALRSCPELSWLARDNRTSPRKRLAAGLVAVAGGLL